MTNEEIIQNEKKLLGMGEFEPLHTFAKWKEMGFKVKKVSVLQFAQNFGNASQRKLNQMMEKKLKKTISS